MMKTLSVRLAENDLERLRAAAEQLGLGPAVLARLLVRTGLDRDALRIQHSHGQFAGALRQLDAAVAAAGGPALDPVELIHAGRHERDQDLTAGLGGVGDAE